MQSDAIESRFRWLRQLSGANYFISMRQVRESDTKIRALSLLKFSKISLNEIDDALLAMDSGSEVASEKEEKTADDIYCTSDRCPMPVMQTSSTMSVVTWQDQSSEQPNVRTAEKFL